MDPARGERPDLRSEGDRPMIEANLLAAVYEEFAVVDVDAVLRRVKELIRVQTQMVEDTKDFVDRTEQIVAKLEHERAPRP
jgi:hypothetical protein